MKIYIYLFILSLVSATACGRKHRSESPTPPKIAFLRNEILQEFDASADTVAERSWTEQQIKRARVEGRVIVKEMESRRSEDDFFYYAPVLSNNQKIFTVLTDHAPERNIFLVAMTGESACTVALLATDYEHDDEFERVISKTADGKNFLRESFRGSHRSEKSDTTVYWEHTFTRIVVSKTGEISEEVVRTLAADSLVVRK